MLIISC